MRLLGLDNHLATAIFIEEICLAVAIEHSIIMCLNLQSHTVMFLLINTYTCTGWWYTVSAEYKSDYILLQDKFGTLFRSISEAVKSQVPVDDLKEYLCENFDDFNIPFQDANTTDDVMKAVRNQSSLTDLAYLDRINDHFNLQVTQEIDRYRSTLDSFCQHTLDNHSYVRSFREDYDRYILSSDKIEFKLQWKAKEKTMNNIRDVLQKSFGHLADHVQIVVIKDGSVVVVCWAPRYLMKELVRQASEHVHSLAEMGVAKLTVGGTEVNIKEVNLYTIHYNNVISHCFMFVSN